MNSSARLDEKIVLITGATRGIGRGIALTLAAQGATIYITGRSSSGGQTTENLPGTVESVAAEVNERGGRGIPMAIDLRDDAQVAALLQRIAAEQDGRLDLLVNNVWPGYEQQPTGLGNAPFWELDHQAHWDRMFQGALRTHLLVTARAVPLMLPRQRGLIVNTIAWAKGKYLLHLYYDLAKQAIARMSYAMALELKPHGIAALALAPGFVRSERVMAAHALNPFPLDGTESPEYIGRAVAALAADPAILARTGKVLTVGDLAVEYGFTDIDGRVIPPFEMPAKIARD